LSRLSLALAIGLVSLAGCGGTSIQEGTPKNIDMTKDYSPKTEMPGMSPAIQKKSEGGKAAGKVPGTP